MQYTEELTPALKLEHWGDGPWVNEPDEFEFEHEGFVCLGRRMSRAPLMFGGYWCAYIVLPDGHPWREKDYDDIEDIEVHGGITFGGLDPMPTSADRHLLGFDCAHSGDIVPSMGKTMERHRKDFLKRMPEFSKFLEESFIFQETYKTYEFVVSEVKSLAEQAKKATE
jgi:hypothetical protein